MNNKDVHTEHCCLFHGCKYGDKDCTVTREIYPASGPCEQCYLELEHQPKASLAKETIEAVSQAQKTYLKTPYIMTDVEADGPIPGEYSMIAVGAVVVEPGLKRTFKGLLRPISDKFVPEALAVSGYSREQTLAFPDAAETMLAFHDWIVGLNIQKPMFIADNNGFDWMFTCWYFHKFLNKNPFGFSSTNLGSIYKGLVKNTRKNFKHLRKTKHTHDPVDDAKGNAEAFLTIIEDMGLRV